MGITHDVEQQPSSSTGREWVAAGRLCMDFVMTGPPTEYGAAYDKFERLAEPADLARWLAACELRADGVQVSRADLSRALELRDALWRLTVAANHGQPTPLADAALVNDVAAGRPLVPRLVDGRQAWDRPTVRQALVEVARDAVALHGHPDQLGRLRECASEDCPRPFYDTSRAGVRRWCDPVRCGDRQRARAYRAHRREE
jgi:predicted RNA-binding Zn ribbon-like protein